MFGKNVVCVFVLDLKKEIVISHVIFAGKRNWCMQHKRYFKLKHFIDQTILFWFAQIWYLIHFLMSHIP